MKDCSYCGLRSPDDAELCVNCGKELDVKQESTIPIAPPTTCYASPAPISKKGNPLTWVILAAATCSVGGIFLLASSVLHVFASARIAAMHTLSLSHARLAANGTEMYINDFDDLFPYVHQTESAVEVLLPYTRDRTVFQSPFAGAKFEFNLNIGGVGSASIKEPSSIPMWLESLPDSTDRFSTAFVDGHAKQIQGSYRPQIVESATKHFERPKGSEPLPLDYLLRESNQRPINH